MSSKIARAITEEHPTTLLLGVYGPHNKIAAQEYYFDEFLSLVETLGTPYEQTLFLKVRATDNNMFFTKGKLEEIQRFCDEHEIEQIICSEILSPLQERNLREAFNCEIMDRTHLILNIFKNSAHTAEGKIQVEMAEIEFLKTRTIGKGKELSQQAGMIGVKGPGETLQEQLKRVFADKLRQAKKRLDTLQKSREVQRKQRLNNKIPLICIIGYTNAGKSSLLNRIAKGDVLAENKLFATLDTTTRELFIDGHKKGLISDTVGFISQLPHNLIEAFKSTLDELKYAALLIQVVDISNPAWESQIEVVQDTLNELEVNKPMVYVFNKVDKLSQEARDVLPMEIAPYTPHVIIHTQSKEGIEQLVNFLKTYPLK